MKKYRAMSLLVATVGALAWATLVCAASTDTTLQASVSGQVGGSTGSAQTQSSSLDSPASGSTEGVTFSGNALIKAKVIEDPDFRTPPIVVLSIDLSGITGVGATSRQKYVTTNETIIQRRLRPSDTVALTFPFWLSGNTSTGKGPLGAISISLTYDVNTRQLTAAAGNITSP
jgi:hypothetical protein